MSDPLSVIASVTGVVAVGGKILFKLAEYLQDVRQAPSHVEALAGELATVTSGLQRYKVQIISRNSSQQADIVAWAADSQTLLTNCQSIFDRINAAVEKAQIKSKTSVSGEIVSRVKWVWNKKEVELLLNSLERYKTTINLMIQTLSSQQVGNIEETTQKIHDLVKEIQAERAHIKEKLLVLDSDHPRFNNPDGVLSYQVRSADSSSSDWVDSDGDGASNNISDDNSTWAVADLICFGTGATGPFSVRCGQTTLNLIFVNGNVPMLEIDLPAAAQAAIEKVITTETKRPVYTPRVSQGERNPNREYQLRVTKGYIDAWEKESFWKKLNPIHIAGLTTTLAFDALVDSAKDINVGMETTWVSDTVRDVRALPAYLRHFTSGRAYYNVSFMQVASVGSPWLQLAPGEDSHRIRRFQGALRIEFQSSQEAEQAEKRLRDVINRVTLAWEAHCRTFAQFNEDVYAVDSPAELRRSAVNEEFRWSTFASLVMASGAIREAL